jgi:hypothetical protein
MLTKPVEFQKKSDVIAALLVCRLPAQTFPKNPSREFAQCLNAHRQTKTSILYIFSGSKHPSKFKHRTPPLPFFLAFFNNASAIHCLMHSRQRSPYLTSVIGMIARLEYRVSWPARIRAL